MSDSVRDALARLAAALDRLDAASLRHADGDRTRAALEAELALMRQDRHDLARHLDVEKSARGRLESGLDDLAPRVDRAITALRAAITGN